MSIWKWVLLGLAVLLAAWALALWWGAQRWGRATQALVLQMQAAPALGTGAGAAARFHSQDLQALPIAAQRYFRAVLKEGQPLIASAQFAHAGSFNMGEQQDQWRPFASNQWVQMQRPGFVWSGRVAMLPGLPVWVHDAYVNGEGLLHPAILGLVSLTRLRGGGDVAQGELLRWLAEAALYPTALLPSHAMRWQAVDEHNARLTFADGSTTVSLTFHFGADDLIETVRADARARTMGGKTVMQPWEGRWWNYAWREGVRVPTQGEVAWLAPEGRKPYWRGQLQSLAYEWQR
jgi:hypothetical protein